MVATGMLATVPKLDHILTRLLPEGGLWLLLLLAASASALWFAERKSGVLSRFIAEEASPLNLGIARAAIFTGLVLQVQLDELLAFGRLDNSLILPPLGWKWIAPHLPRSNSLLEALYYLLVVSGTLAVIGLWTRASTAVASLLGFYLLSIPQLFGQVVHYNHLVLFSFLLAVSPCGDAFSLDAWLHKRRFGRAAPALEPSTYYAAPLKIIMVVMGIAYYFAGAWKVCRVGIRWFTPDYMRLILLVKMQEFNPTSFQLWTLKHPAMLILGAIFTIAFEIGFVFAILNRRTRILAFLSGIAFHNLTYALMQIQFLDMQVCYVTLVDWGWLVAAFRARTLLNAGAIPYGQELSNYAAPRLRLSFRVAAFIITVGMLIGGVTHIVNGWPIGCYPTFDWQPDSRVKELGFEVQSASGKVDAYTLDFDRRMAQPYSPERWKSLVAEVTREDIPSCDTRSRELLRLWAAAYRRSDIQSATLYLDIYDFEKSTTVPIEHRLMGTIPMTGPNSDRQECTLR